MARFDWGAFIILMAPLFSSSMIQAEPVLEQVGRMKLDWGNMTVRFSGSYKPEPKSAEIPLSEAEQHAMTEGLLYAREALAKIHEKELRRQGVSSELASQSAQQASDLVTRTTYSFDTSFFKGGGVQVYLENGLGKVFSRKDVAFRKGSEEDKKGSRFSGLILRLDKAMRPVAKYEVVDQSGSRLFTMDSMTKEAYEKNLMGRWFIDPRREELVKYLGPKRGSDYAGALVSIQVKVLDADKLMVQKGVWTDALQDSMQVLSEGRIALVIPK